MPDALLAPRDVIPHREPFLLLTAVSELEEGVRAVGHWQLTGEEPFFGGHFPGRPTLPGVLMCESIAQLGAYALLSDEAFAGRLALFGGIDRVRVACLMARAQGRASSYVSRLNGAIAPGR